MAPRKRTRASKPPVLPDLDRKLKFGGWQLVGLAVIMLIPVLAAFKVFGEGSATAVDGGPSVSMSVEYPSRLRHGTLEEVSVLITNRAGSPLDTVSVLFDSSYVARFTDPQFVPSATEAYKVDLTDVAPGETRRAQLGVRASQYGRHRGRIAAVHAADTVGVAISTIVFP